MQNWAVFESQGKQHKAGEGEIISIDKLPASKDGKINFDKVLLVKTESKLGLGKPYIEKAKVTANIEGDYRDKKIRVVKFKSKSRYTRVTGHRQTMTRIKIEKILA
ncbi:50S ribosomal protein L21 [Candidatus Curtissbacteria bacterium]|nr:50S ribosomal protein L21 [Candidatus Curtissbacteria bacterium]